ncbi:RidA family protein [Yinghuangia seranimata]|uniref:RidA family protein n=1 Tax=Yinghuangia seranimata TaxID=408067 RepID=UPI00248B22D4|nr:RidA family protein [Yinghuangia seranimata]MDI2131873.1 RidA family protein [Yinghuangia seranimata]
MARQTRTAYAKIRAILAAAGLGLDDVTRVVENVTARYTDQHGAPLATDEETIIWTAQP